MRGIVGWGGDAWVVFGLNFVQSLLNKSKVYQVVNNIMNICLHLLALLVITHSQIILRNFEDLTLLDASNLDSDPDTQLIAVFDYILETHPELQSYVIASLSKEKNPASVSQYYIMARNNDMNVMIAVTVQADLTFFVSYNKVPTPIPNNIAKSISIVNSNKAAAYESQNEPIPTNGSQQLSGLLGGYHKLNNLKEEKFRRALKFLHEQHPNLANYQLLTAYYQVVSGINYLMHFKGVDRITAVQAKVHLTLDAQLTITLFKVSCASPAHPATPCSDSKAYKIYSGCELSVNTHPELLDYRLISIFIEEQRDNSLIFMATFQNDVLKLRAISQISSSDNNAKILSYYSYNFRDN